MKKYLKFSLLLLVFTVSLSSIIAYSAENLPQTVSEKEMVQNIGKVTDSMVADPADAVPMSHVGPCYPWVWSWNTWWHHHVYWTGCFWDHTYARADFIYSSFFQRYVWACTWPGCGAIRF